jgi:signal transduction histidine kinase
MRSGMRRRDVLAVMITGTVVILGLLTVFAIELSNTQAKSKADVEARVHERSVLAAALIDSLFQTSAGTSASMDARQFGAAKVPNRRLDKLAGSNRYVVLLDPSGQVLAQTAGFTAQARHDLNYSESLRLLRLGRPWALGNVLPYGSGGVIDFGIALNTHSGVRYLLTGFSPRILGPFLQGELRQIPGVRGAHNFVLDGNGEVLSSTYAARPTGYVFHTPVWLAVLHHPSGEALGHYYDQVPLANTSWRVLLTAPDGPLFASVSGLRKWLPWVIFAAFAIVGVLALLLALRALRSSDAVREAKDELEVANLQLADSNAALASSNAELGRRAQELARSNAELDQFASIASHDLQEPLRKVRTFTERVTDTESAVLSERGRDYLQRAGASAERMQRLIEDLLKFSRVTTQSRPFVPVDLGQVTREVLEDLDEQVRGADALVRVGALPTISADAPQMRQLLQNLISNALKFRREDVRPEIDISAVTEEEGWVKLTVRDNGIGFEEQYAERIFRVFERLHGRGYPGTGIGLPLCLKIAERHGGTVLAQSVPGRGSTFTVAMQSQRTEAVTDRPPARPPDAPRSTREPYVAV